MLYFTWKDYNIFYQVMVNIVITINFNDEKKTPSFDHGPAITEKSSSRTICEQKNNVIFCYKRTIDFC